MSDWQHGGPPPAGWWWNGSGWVTVPQPGVIPLRPLSLGDILSGVFTTIRRNLAATLGAAAVVMLVVEATRVTATYFLFRGISTATVTTAFDGTTDFHGSTLARIAGLEAVVAVVSLISTALLAGMLTAAVGPAVLGQPTAARGVWREARPMIGRLVATALLVAAAIFLAVIVGIVPGLVVTSIGSGVGSDPVTAVGVVLLVVGGIGAILAAAYLGTALSMATPIVMLEKQRPVAALRRSRALVRGSWWRVFGITLLVGLIAGAIAALISVPFDLAAGISNVFSSDPAKQAGLRALTFGGIGAFAGGTLGQPLAAVGRTLLYVDLRMRTEGLHLTLQRAASTAADQ